MQEGFSLTELREQAEQGMVEAQFFLGELHQQGEGVPQDKTEAAKWYWAAAEQGSDIAQSMLGYMSLTGDGIAQDFIQAHKWFNLSIGGGKGEIAPVLPRATREDLVIVCDNIADIITTEQIAEAQRLATEWKPKPWEVIRKELKIGPPE